MKTFLYGDDGDIDITQGVRLTTTLAEYAMQRLDENLSEFLGEWFLDQRRGIPYFKHMLGVKNPDMGLIESVFRRAILQSPGIGGLDFLKLSFTRDRRKLEVRFKARLTDGELLGTEDQAPFIIELGN
jgi:hypothetical protein